MMLKVNLFPHIQAMESKLQRRLTSKEIAEGANIHESTYSTYKTGSVKMVKLETLEKLADFFGCEAGELLKKV